jgi:hypothetical protein
MLHRWCRWRELVATVGERAMEVAASGVDQWDSGDH